MGIQLESVIRAIVNACQSVLPVWYGQADEGAQMPYAVMTMESSDVTILSGGPAFSNWRAVQIGPAPINRQRHVVGSGYALHHSRISWGRHLAR